MNDPESEEVLFLGVAALDALEVDAFDPALVRGDDEDHGGASLPILHQQGYGPALVLVEPAAGLGHVLEPDEPDFQPVPNRVHPAGPVGARCVERVVRLQDVFHAFVLGFRPAVAGLQESLDVVENGTRQAHRADEVTEHAVPAGAPCVGAHPIVVDRDEVFADVARAAFFGPDPVAGLRRVVGVYVLGREWADPLGLVALDPGYSTLALTTFDREALLFGRSVGGGLARVGGGAAVEVEEQECRHHRRDEQQGGGCAVTFDHRRISVSFATTPRRQPPRIPLRM